MKIEIILIIISAILSFLFFLIKRIEKNAIEKEKLKNLKSLWKAKIKANKSYEKIINNTITDARDWLLKRKRDLR